MPPLGIFGTSLGYPKLEEKTVANTPIWKPSAERIAKSLMTQFHAKVSVKYGINQKKYSDLHRWSIDQPQHFWKELSDFVGIRWQRTAGTTLTSTHPKETMLTTQWFPGSLLNYAENLLEGAPDAVCLTSYSENSHLPINITKKDLTRQVHRCADWLRCHGLTPGDRVGAITANTPEAIIAMLAVTSIGGVWASCSPDFGVSGIRDRFAQIGAKFIFYSQSYSYNGKIFDCQDKVHRAVQGFPEAAKIVAIPNIPVYSKFSLLQSVT